MAKGRYKTGGFYWERELYQSEAFLSLGKNTMKLIIALLDSRQREPSSKAKDRKGVKRKPKFTNLDHLEMPYGTLEKTYNIPRGSIPQTLDEALAKGFIKIMHRGGAYKHDKAVYGWSDR